MKTLTRKELDRQDFVDNEIFELIQRLLPADKKLKWDIEIIGSVRDAMQDQIINKQAVSKKQFYPYKRINTDNVQHQMSNINRPTNLT